MSNVNICIGLTPPPPSLVGFVCTVMGADRRRCGPEAIAGCLEAPRITVSAGRRVHHRRDLRTEGERTERGVAGREGADGWRMTKLKGG